MISETELIAVKARLMLAADAANLIVSSPGPAPVKFTEEQYWRVHESLSRMRDDLAAVLSELDTLRALFVDSVHEFFGAKVTDEIPISTIAVAAMSDGEDRNGGETPRDDAAVPSEPAPARRAYRKRRTKGTKSGRDTESLHPTAEGVDTRDEGESVGGQQTNE